MTSTSINIGLGEGAKNSSRVLRPPGGGHSNIFNNETEPVRGRRQLSGAPDQIIAHKAEPKAENGSSNLETVVEKAAEPTPNIPEKAPAPQPQAAAEPPKRVRVPPGGFSSGLW